MSYRGLLENLQDLTCTYGTTTLTDSETKTLVQRYRVDQLYGDSYVVTWHNHIYTLWQRYLTGNVHSTEVELRTVLVVEWSVTTTLLCARKELPYGGSR